MRPVGRIYLERGEHVLVLIQWGLKSRGESYGGPRNVLIERESGELVVRPFRGLRPVYMTSRGNKIPLFAPFAELDDEARALQDELMSQPCGHCGRHLDGWWLEAHDPCIANLPGVIFACCGHGVAVEGDDGVMLDKCYLVFRDGRELRGDDAREAMRALGGNPPAAAAGVCG